MGLLIVYLRTCAFSFLLLFFGGSYASDSVDFKPGALLRKLDGLTLAAVKDRDVLFDEIGFRGRVNCDPIVKGYCAKCEGGEQVLGGDLSVMMRWLGSGAERNFSIVMAIDEIDFRVPPEKLVSDYLGGWWGQPRINKFSESESDLYLKGVCELTYKKKNSQGVYLRVVLGCGREGRDGFVKSIRISVEDAQFFL